MNEIDKYLHELKRELRDLPEAVQSDLLAEVQTHIEDGLEDETLVDATAVQHAVLLQELGSPAELVRNLHWSNWKRNGRDAALAIIPFRLLQPLTATIDKYLGTDPTSPVLSYFITFLICLGMVLLARRLRSRLLTGWWLSNTLTTAFFVFLHSISWQNERLLGAFWWLWPLALVILIGGFYGRFLWQNRHDGLTLTVSLTPFMWATISIISLGSLGFMPGYEWRQFWTSILAINTWLLIALTAFIFPGRRARWLLLFIWFSIYSFGSIALWLPNANAGFWFLLLLPFLLGFGIELASSWHYKQTTVIASA